MADPLPRRIAWFAPWTWKRRWIAAAILAALVVAYPLSFGPAWWLLSHRWISAEWSLTIYRPIWWIFEKSRVGNWLLAWFMAFFAPIP